MKKNRFIYWFKQNPEILILVVMLISFIGLNVGLFHDIMAKNHKNHNNYDIVQEGSLTLPAAVLFHKCSNNIIVIRTGVYIPLPKTNTFNNTNEEQQMIFLTNLVEIINSAATNSAAPIKFSLPAVNLFTNPWFAFDNHGIVIRLFEYRF